MRLLLIGAFIFVSSCLAQEKALAGDTLDNVRQAGRLACGVNIEEADYSKSQTHGNLSALGLDVCKAVAAAVLGDAGKLTPVVLHDDPQSLEALKSGKIALLAGGTPDLTNQAAFGVGFGPPVFLDGQGFLVHKATGVDSITDLSGRQVCFLADTQAEQDLDDGLAQRGVSFRPFPFEETGEMEAALITGHCAAIAAPISALANMRPGFHGRISQYEILPETITLEPFVPVYRAGDPQWAAIVAWTIHALVLAEDAGVTQANAAELRRNGRPEVRYLLGGAAGIGRPLGLDDDWALRAVQAVGNYGEVFDRDIGAASPLRLERGRNALWTHGGMMFAPPIR
ncbi:amino acid ABC transporter substrate-binding protein [Rhodopila sp.]|uniref:amino acid ABC transporter substrate-binding protein n=1 Tax=Rhodopila sp. TaxID=2480087 RepID=UPI003D09BD2C